MNHQRLIGYGRSKRRFEVTVVIVTGDILYTENGDNIRCRYLCTSL